MNNCHLYHFMIRKYEANATTMVDGADFDFRFSVLMWPDLALCSILSPGNVFSILPVLLYGLLSSYIYVLSSYFPTEKIASPVFYTSLDDGTGHDSIHVYSCAGACMQVNADVLKSHALRFIRTWTTNFCLWHREMCFFPSIRASEKNKKISAKKWNEKRPEHCSRNRESCG